VKRANPRQEFNEYGLRYDAALSSSRSRGARRCACGRRTNEHLVPACAVCQVESRVAARYAAANLSALEILAERKLRQCRGIA
jgi:hypothetical protein